MLNQQGLGKRVGVEGEMDGTESRAILEENLSQSARDLRCGQSFIFQLKTVGLTCTENELGLSVV